MSRLEAESPKYQHWVELDSLVCCLEELVWWPWWEKEIRNGVAAAPIARLSGFKRSLFRLDSQRT